VTTGAKDAVHAGFHALNPRLEAPGLVFQAGVDLEDVEEISMMADRKKPRYLVCTWRTWRAHGG